MDNKNILQGGGGHNSYQFGCFAPKFGRILNSSNQSKVKAFTLAEVLITLVIIGVVAALTIPSVVVSYQKHETVTRLKKAYSTLSQTTNKAIADHGPIKNWEISPETGNGETKAFVDKYMTPYLNVSKNCEYRTDGDCEFKWAYLNAQSGGGTVGNKRYKLVLNDGSTVFSTSKADTKTINGVNIPVTYLYVIIDVNGNRAPNVYGKDKFVYMYFVKWDLTPAGPGYKDYSGKFLPNGYDTARNNILSGNCGKNGTGVICAALIMNDGWQIKDDYPW